MAKIAINMLPRICQWAMPVSEHVRLAEARSPAVPGGGELRPIGRFLRKAPKCNYLQLPATTCN
jgi:hypothetical protein